jgi:CheY-like chemotaxis protein
MNLFLNAAEAIRDRGEISATTKTIRLVEKKARELGLEPGNYVTMSVADNGSGIPVADMKHIFEPFYSKKELGRSGTGIGLTVVWNAMQDQGGTVTVHSDDNGSVFTLYFPLTEGDCEPPLKEDVISSKTQKIDFRGQGERILIVDDEVVQRSILMEILSEYGYRVHAVGSGGDAVDYVRLHEVELVVLDMILGNGLDGLETYRKIVQLRPQQKALIASGFSQSEKIEAASRLGVGGFVKKPYSVETIIRMVHDELEK